MNLTDPMQDHRARLERTRLEAAQRRSDAINEQRSSVNTPAQRVRVWERLHRLSLPRDPAHAVLLVVARQTGLRLAEVREVQRQRANPVPAVLPEQTGIHET